MGFGDKLRALKDSAYASAVGGSDALSSHHHSSTAGFSAVKVCAPVGPKSVRIELGPAASLTAGKVLEEALAQFAIFCHPRFLGLEYVSSASGDRDFLDPDRRVATHPINVPQQQQQQQQQQGSEPVVFLKFRLRPPDVDAAFRIGREGSEDENGMELLFKQLHMDISSKSDRVSIPDVERRELQRLYEGFHVTDYIRKVSQLGRYYPVHHSLPITNSYGKELSLQILFTGVDIIDPTLGSDSKHFTPTGGLVPWAKVADAAADRRGNITINLSNIESVSSLKLLASSECAARRAANIIIDARKVYLDSGAKKR